MVEKDNALVQLIQVSKSVKDERTYKREVAPFAKTKKELHLTDVACLLISEDDTKSLEEGIKLVNIKEWCLL